MYIYHGLLLSLKNEKMPLSDTWMDPEITYHTKRRQISYNVTYMWNLQYGTNEPIYKTETDSQTQTQADGY